MTSNKSDLSLDTLVPRLGEVLVKEGLLSELNLKDALREQENLRAAGANRHLGAILLEKGFITQEILDQTITAQIVQYQDALKSANQQLEKRVEERTRELEHAYQQLSEFHVLKSNFVASLSHELRTPLTHIKGYLDLYLDDKGFEFSEEVRSGLLVMQRASIRLQKLIDDLVLFSESEAGLMKLRSTNFNLKPVIELLIMRNRDFAERKKIDLKAEFLAAPFVVVADQRNITWVIDQLIENAVKFTPEEGAVTVFLQNTGAEVVIRVKDTGIGFDSSKMEAIFEPYQQLEGSSKRKQGGIGLGLALTRNILEMHGCTLGVISQPGLGSEFSFSLPATVNPD